MGVRFQVDDVSLSSGLARKAHEAVPYRLRDIGAEGRFGTVFAGAGEDRRPR